MGSQQNDALETPSLLTVAEVAAILRVRKLTVYEWVKCGKLPAVKFGRVIRIPSSALQVAA